MSEWISVVDRANPDDRGYPIPIDLSYEKWLESIQSEALAFQIMHEEPEERDEPR